MRQALAERIKPVLMINKLDRCVFETQLQPEELYQSLRSVVERFNVMVATYSDDSVGDLMVFIGIFFSESHLHIGNSVKFFHEKENIFCFIFIIIFINILVFLACYLTFTLIFFFFVSSRHKKWNPPY